MAKKQTFTVTHPDGTVSKRTSTSRTYTHAVVREIGRQQDINNAQTSADSWRETAEQYEAAAESGEFTTERKSWIRGDERITAQVGGFYVGSWIEKDGKPASERDVVLDEETGRANLREYAAKARENAAHYQAKAEEAEQAPEVRYEVPRWSSRLDLAQTAAQGEFACASEHVKVYVVAVDQA